MKSKNPLSIQNKLGLLYYNKTKMFIVIIILLATLSLSIPSNSNAESLNVAVAANFILPFKKIAFKFENETGIHVDGTFTSTGNLYSQIRNGAPYDLFLAADTIRPDLLYHDGLTEKPFIYATGSVVLWSLTDKFSESKNWKEVLKNNPIKKVAIANPETAPYGAASLEAINIAGLKEEIMNRAVIAQTIAQVFQYAHTGSVDVGFCALSSAVSEKGKKGFFLPIDEAPKITQAGCILARSQKIKGAEKFAQFLLSSEVKKLISEYGYN